MPDFDTVYREFHPKILRYLHRMCGENDAADLAQTVFFKVSRSLDTFRGDSSLSTWVYRIAANTANDHASSSLARQRECEELPEDEGSPDDYPDSTLPAADREYIRREMSACIRGVIEGLQDGYRSVLILSEFDELSNIEIADVLGISIDAVKIRLHRARNILREALKCECHLYHDERNELMCDQK